jgi:hypothetical protein
MSDTFKGGGERATMSNRCSEIHDSILARISDSGSFYELHLSAMYIHQSEVIGSGLN